MNIRAVFWDIDGTIVMSEPLHDAKIKFLATSNDITLTAEIISSFHGVGDPKVYEIMRDLGFSGTLQDFMNQCDNYYFAHIDTVDIRDGFEKAFEYFERQGLFQSAVSNGTLPLVKVNLERAGITAKLKAIVDLDYVMEQGLSPKPAADPYLEALRQINEKMNTAITPGECLVIEDSPTGVAAGKAAGMTTIYWKLSPLSPITNTDYEAFKADELLGIVQQIVPAVPAVA